MGIKKQLPRKKNKASLWLCRAFLASAAMLLGLNLYQWNAKKLVGNALPMPFGVGISVVLSGSMEPTLSVNDLVIVQSKESYHPGDIIVFQAESQLIIHRVIGVDGQTLITQGDANPVPDAPVAISAVNGRMLAAIPGIGVAVRALKTPVGTAVVLVAAILLMEGSFRKEKERNERELERLKEEIRRLREEQNEKR